MYKLVYSPGRGEPDSFMFRDVADLNDRCGDRGSARLVTVEDLIDERGLDPDDEDDAVEIAKFSQHGQSFWEIDGRHDTEYLPSTTPEREIIDYLALNRLNDWYAHRVIDLNDDQDIIDAWEAAPGHGYVGWRNELRDDLPQSYKDSFMMRVSRAELHSAMITFSITNPEVENEEVGDWHIQRATDDDCHIAVALFEEISIHVNVNGRKEGSVDEVGFFDQNLDRRLEPSHRAEALLSFAEAWLAYARKHNAYKPDWLEKRIYAAKEVGW